MTRTLAEDRLRAEQHRRMKSAFVANEPSDADILSRMAILRARKRIGLQETRRRLAPVGWGVLVGILFCGSALALAGKTGHLELSWGELGRAEQKTPASPQPEQSTAGAASGKVSVPTGLRLDEKPLPVEGERESTARESKRSAPPATNVRKRLPTWGGPLPPSSPRRTAPPRVSHRVAPPPELTTRPQQAAEHPPSAAFGLPPPSAPVDGASDSARWRRVADSMRAGKDTAALAELERIAQSEKREEREAAAILKWQLVFEMEGAEAVILSELNRLAVSGSTPSIRASAQRLARKIGDEQR